APPKSAIARLAKDPVSRRKFMTLTGGSAAMGAVLAACGSIDDSTTTSSTSSSTSADTRPPADMFGTGDLGILNYALTLEYLETAFYQDVVKSGLFKGSDLATIKTFGSQEAQHVAALTGFVKQMGGKPAPKPKTE